MNFFLQFIHFEMKNKPHIHEKYFKLIRSRMNIVFQLLSFCAIAKTNFSSFQSSALFHLSQHGISARMKSQNVFVKRCVSVERSVATEASSQFKRSATKSI